jgi:cell division protein FtsL
VTAEDSAAAAGEQPAAPPRAKFTGRAAVLAVVLCAIGLSLAYPVREYIAERRQIDELQAKNTETAAKVKRLQAEQRALSSPSYIEQLARDKLHMCFPSQTCYVVVLPARPNAGATRASQPPWYAKLWQSVEKADAPVKSTHSASKAGSASG